MMVEIADRLGRLTTEGNLAALCRRWKIRELSLFGSVLRDDFGPASDIDVLISFEDNAPWSLWDLTMLQDELSRLFGRQVDLVEREGLRNPFRRDRILKTCKVLYASGDLAAQSGECLAEAQSSRSDEFLRPLRTPRLCETSPLT